MHLIRRRYLIAAGSVLLSVLFLTACSVLAQTGNRISGRVYGLERRPVPDLNVELLDDLGRMIARTLTSSAGSYQFSGLSDGAFVVRVYTFGTDYQEQENRVEIRNVTYTTSTGRVLTGGFEDAQSDFYLKLRKGVTPQNVALFVQEVPPEAKKLYDKALSDLDDKKTPDGLAELRRAIEIFPKYYAALERLGTEYVRMGTPEGYQAAEIVLAAAVEVNPRAYKSWYGLAYARYSEKRYPEALAAAQKAVELNASSPDAVFLLGVILRHEKKYSDAEKQLLKAKELSNDNVPQVHWELALLYGNDLKRYDDAAKELKLYLKLRPEGKDADTIRKLIKDLEEKAKAK